MGRTDPLGVPPRGRYWYVRRYLTGALAVLLSLVVSFALLQQVLPRLRALAAAGEALEAQAEPCTPDCVGVPYILGLDLGFDPAAPVHEQFLPFLVTRLTYPPVAALLVGGAALTAALWWRDRRSRGAT